MPYLTVSLLVWIYALYASGRTAESDEDLYSFFGASENIPRRNDYRPMSRLQIYLDRFLMHHPKLAWGLGTRSRQNVSGF